MMETLLNLSQWLSKFLFPTLLLSLTLLTSLLFWPVRFFKKLLFLVFIYFYLSANGVIPSLLIQFLEPTKKPVSLSDICSHKAMVVLGGGVSLYPNMYQLNDASEARLLEAFRIYRKAKTHCHTSYTIFLSGGDVNGIGKTEGDLLKENLLLFGVPEESLIVENKSLNTGENAKFTKRTIKDYPFKQFLLVTSAMHMKRAQQYFTLNGIDTLAAPSEFAYPKKGFIPSGFSLVVQDKILHEYLGLIKIKLQQFLGLIKPQNALSAKHNEASKVESQSPHQPKAKSKAPHQDLPPP